MRDIKFRGIPIKKEDRDKFGYEVGKPIDKFIYGDLEIDYNCGGGTKYYISMEVFGAFTYRDRIQVIPETIGQFTGLKDKNGKEIYEGDVVRYKDENLTIQWFQTTQGVGWHKDNGKEIELVSPFERFEIIGNIHDKGEIE